MRKIPFAILSIIIGIGSLVKLWNASFFLSLAANIEVCMLGAYTISVSLKKTKFFHHYIGKTGMIIPTCMAVYLLVDKYTSWNRAILFVIGLCVGIVILYLWSKDEKLEIGTSDFLAIVSTIVIATSIGGCCMALNESYITQTEYEQVEITDKQVFISTQTIVDHPLYSVTISKQERFYNKAEIDVSKEYYNKINVGDRTSLCVCTGLLGGKFYFLPGESDPWYDFYGLNQ